MSTVDLDPDLQAAKRDNLFSPKTAALLNPELFDICHKLMPFRFFATLDRPEESVTTQSAKISEYSI
jgi:hypothetical protein